MPTSLISTVCPGHATFNTPFSSLMKTPLPGLLSRLHFNSASCSVKPISFIWNILNAFSASRNVCWRSNTLLNMEIDSSKLNAISLCHLLWRPPLSFSNWYTSNILNLYSVGCCARASRRSEEAFLVIWRLSNHIRFFAHVSRQTYSPCMKHLFDASSITSPHLPQTGGASGSSEM